MSKLMSDWRTEEMQNRTIFRDMNEWTVEGRVAQAGDDPTTRTYLCECSDSRCTAPIDLTWAEYEAVRAEAVRFVIAVNHENPEIERVVSENERFATVEKFGSVGCQIARATDPRR